MKVNSKLQPSDGGVLEHESICKALELAIEYDQLNIGELAAVELLCRRLQMIQYRWKERVLGAVSSGTVDDESHFFLGVDPTRGNLCICPALNAWLGDELHKEAQANKEQRKAREERALLRANNVKPPFGGVFDHGVALSTRATSCSSIGWAASFQFAAKQGSFQTPLLAPRSGVWVKRAQSNSVPGF